MLCNTIFLLLASTFFTCAFGVHVRSCRDSPPGNIVSVNWVNVYPERLVLPGNMTVSASVTLHEPLTGNLEADLTVSRRFGPMWIDLPCVNTARGRMGSCTYSNLCGTLMSNGTQCPSVLARNGIPCTCPVSPQTFTVQPTTVSLDLSRLGIPSIAVAGEYQASLRVTDKDTMTELICYDFFVEIAEPERSSTFGSLGRFLINLFG